MIPLRIGSRERVKEQGLNLLVKIYDRGVVPDSEIREAGSRIYLKKGAVVQETTFDELFQKQSIDPWISQQLSGSINSNGQDLLAQVLQASIVANVFYDDRLTESSIEQAIEEVNPNQGIIEKGVRIIAKGEVVEGEKFQVLKSLEQRYRSDVWSQANYYWVVLGYSILVSLVFIMLFFVLKEIPTSDLCA